MTRLLRYLLLIIAHPLMFPASRVSVAYFLMLLAFMGWDVMEQHLKDKTL